ncbi:MAG: hypothetical protein R6X06_12600 [Gammaproteobacteria bacterium]
MPVLFSIIESPLHPDFEPLYREQGLVPIRLTSMRKAITALKKQAPDFVVAEFFYGYGNNYAGVNISNLDVFLYSLQRYAPQARVIVLVDGAERQYVCKLEALFPLHAVLPQPVTAAQMKKALTTG